MTDVTNDLASLGPNGWEMSGDTKYEDVPGGGATAFTALTDAGSVDLRAINAPLDAALDAVEAAAAAAAAPDTAPELAATIGGATTEQKTALLAALGAATQPGAILAKSASATLAFSELGHNRTVLSQGAGPHTYTLGTDFPADADVVITPESNIAASFTVVAGAGQSIYVPPDGAVTSAGAANGIVSLRYMGSNAWLCTSPARPAASAAVVALQEDVADIQGSLAGISSSALLIRGGEATNMVDGRWYRMGAVDLGQLEVGDLIRVRAAYAERNGGTVSGDLVLGVFFVPADSTDYSYVLPGVYKTFPATADGHGVLAHEYMILAPGTALCLTGGSAGIANAGLHSYGAQIGAGFRTEIPGSGTATFSTANPIFTDSPLKLVLAARRVGGGTEDWLQCGPLDAKVIKGNSSSKGLPLQGAANVSFTSVLPLGVVFDGPPLASMDDGGFVSTNGVSASTPSSNAVLRIANWAMSANPQIPLSGQKFEFISNAASVQPANAPVTFATSPMLDTFNRAPLTAANFGTVVGSLMTGSVSGVPAFSFVSSAAGGGKTALECYVHPQDGLTGGAPRAEIDCVPRLGDFLCGHGDEIWFGMKVVFPTSGSLLDLYSGSVTQFFQMHAGAVLGGKNSPCLAFETIAGDLHLRRYFSTVETHGDSDFTSYTNPSTLIKTAPAKATEHVVMMRAALRGGTAHASGLTEIRFNNEAVISVPGGNCYSASKMAPHRMHTTQYGKLGVYNQKHVSAPADDDGKVQVLAAVFVRNAAPGVVTFDSLKAALDALN